MYINSLASCIIFNCSMALFIGCAGNESAKNDISIGNFEKNSENSSKYIKMEDSKDFLPSWSKENVLIYHVVGEPDEMHPTNGLNAYRGEIMGYTQVFLIGTDFQSLTMRPIAVKSMPVVSENGKEYTYELRNDIKFDDGSTLSTEDVLFTFKANKCPLTNNPNAKSYLENLVDIVIDKTDPNKFKVIMKDTYIQNISFLSTFPLMQRSFFDKKNVLSNYSIAQFSDKNFNADKLKELTEWAAGFNSAKYSRDPNFIVGAGPYRFEKWDAGQSITLVKKKNHWSDATNSSFERAYPEKIIFKLNTDANSQKLEFKAQTLDASSSLSSKTLMELQADANFNTNYNSRFMDTYNYSYIAMNMKPDGIKHKKIFTDKTVRRAMALLVPVDELIRILQKGKNRRVAGPVSPLKIEYNTALKLLPFDLEGAKKLLDNSGWKDTDGDNIRDKMIDGEKVKMEFNLGFFSSSIEWKELAEMVSEQMNKAGVKANLDPKNSSVLAECASNHDFDMFIASWGGSIFPEDFTQLWHSSSWVSKGSNFTGFGTIQTDALIDSIKFTLDTAKSIPMIKRFQSIVYDEQPYIFLFSGVRRNVIHKRFGNQEMYYERPGVWLSSLRLINSGSSMKMSTAIN